MKLFVRVSMILMALCLLSTAAMAGDSLPVNSGIVAWLVPQAALYDFGATMKWEDKIDGNKFSKDTDLTYILTGGLNLQVSYITQSPLFIAGEFTYHTYLYKADKEKFEKFEKVSTDSGDKFANFGITDAREGVLIGAYLMQVPFRPFVAVGGGINEERLNAFGRDFNLLAFNVSGLVGGDFFVSRHFAAGASARVNYFVGETFTGDFTRDGAKHEVTATLTRTPLEFNFRLGYMF